MPDSLAYYASFGPMTDPGECLEQVRALPADIPALVTALQGLQIHAFWLGKYRSIIPQERQQAEVNLRSVRQKLTRILELSPLPLTETRPPELRLVGNCRDFSLLMAGFLRTRGVPARARCGFATYFTPNRYEDHWVFEYWHASEARWVMADAQLTPYMMEVLKVDFNPLDMPPGKFITGGRAWLMCRREGANPAHFGIFKYHGWDFIRGDLLRDVLALNKIEILPWDFWQAMQPPYGRLRAAQRARLDALAELTERPEHFDEASFQAARQAYESDPWLHAPADWLGGKA